MSKGSSSALSPKTLSNMLEYLHREAEQAQTVDELADVLKLAFTLIAEAQTVETVQGLDNIRASVPTPGENSNVQTSVPESLVSTFYDLSDKMNHLFTTEPEAFTNASKALHWLANNDKCYN